MPYNTNPISLLFLRHEAVLDEKSIIEFSMCCILTNTLRINENIEDKNLDKFENK